MSDTEKELSDTSFHLKQIAREEESSEINCDGTLTLEKAELLSRKRRVSLFTAVKLRYAAIVASWLSALCGLTQGVVSFVLSVEENSSSLFAFGLDACLDSTSSIVVLWRFYGKELYSENRERKACFVIGFLFLLSTLLLAGKSIFDLIAKTFTVPASTIAVLYIVNGVLNVILASVKIVIGYKLESIALITDSSITYIGAAMSFTGLGALEAYMKNPDLWYLDSVIGLIFSVTLLIFSGRLMCITASIWRQAEETKQ